jgi:hypothetical protein
VFSDKMRSGSTALRRSTHEYSSYHLDKEEVSAPKLTPDDNPTTDSLVSRVVDKCMTEDDFEVPAYEPVPFYPECSFGFFLPGESFQQIYIMAKDQVGCRLLQKKLDEKDLLSIQSIFSQTVQHFPDLMIDPFGNYLCQKLLEVCDPAQLGMVIEIVSPTIVDISLNAHGTRSVQKLIEVSCKTPFIAKIVAALKNSVVNLAQDLNGNHVIQKCLNVLEPPHDQFIYEIASKSVVEIATHRHGCCVLQRCIDAAKGKQKLSLVQCIVDHAVVLIQDAYGNYVVQYVLDLQLPEVNGRLAQIFCKQLVDLSKQKFSSNVIEKCLQLNEPEVQEFMIKEIMKHVPQMLMDQYANYGNL